MLLLHLVSRAEETMTLFVSSFKHFHGPLPAGPHQWPAQAETGKVSGNDAGYTLWVPENRGHRHGE